MAAAKTRNELITRTLEILGVAQAGQTPAAEDTALVDAQIDSVIETLAALSIVYVGDPDAIDLKVFQGLAVMVADSVSADFGKSGAMRVPEPDGESRYAKAEHDLRLVNKSAYAGAPLQLDYF